MPFHALVKYDSIEKDQGHDEASQLHSRHYEYRVDFVTFYLRDRDHRNQGYDGQHEVNHVHELQTLVEAKRQAESVFQIDSTDEAQSAEARVAGTHRRKQFVLACR